MGVGMSVVGMGVMSSFAMMGCRVSGGMQQRAKERSREH